MRSCGVSRMPDRSRSSPSSTLLWWEMFGEVACPQSLPGRARPAAGPPTTSFVGVSSLEHGDSRFGDAGVDLLDGLLTRVVRSSRSTRGVRSTRRRVLDRRVGVG